ncbi:hypothetical protein IAD21_01064 [Abditibacteriota bacterium]|nr:hypothetical protein IAD21_01064 [Abditibacteriota bacterium]
MAQPTQERLAAQLEKPQETPGNVGHAGSGTGPENAPHFEEHEEDHVHHVAMSTYYVIFALLMVLLFITVGAWYIDQHLFSLGHFSTPIAMAIAVAKAVAIVLFFMHVKFASRLVQIFACTGVAFVSIMFLLTLQDYVAREYQILPQPGLYSVTAVPHIRASSVGAASNAQGTPADNMLPMNKIVTYSGTANTGVRGANISIAPGTPAEGISPNGGSAQPDESRPGATIGGAANNSFGSTAQSLGIEPRVGAPAVKPATKPASPKPAIAAKPAPAAR